MVGFLLKAPYADHERQEEQVRTSGARMGHRASRAVDRRGGTQYKYVKKIAIEKVPSSIARADVADFLVEACAASAWVGHAVQLGG